MEENPGKEEASQIGTATLDDGVFSPDESKYSLSDAVGDGESRRSDGEDDRKIEKIGLSGDVTVKEEKLSNGNLKSISFIFF